MKRSKLVSILFMISALTVSANAALAHHTPVSRGDGGDIIVFEIVDSVDDDSHSSDLVDGGHDDSGEGRPAGGGGGGDIVGFDIFGVGGSEGDRPHGGGGGEDMIFFGNYAGSYTQSRTHETKANF